ncbi:TlpA family protein disulfide reductase [Cryptosporangium aurantiacum]|uniref:Thioredoxin n=1 Tax=Cryptosporangium aurantiacum TaxID=134849 RepID=A0A1M7RHB6_9ACTN|nr:thioredoxin family protein [Cryptosporangium aurantiacum]SHN45705.1 Thioredoxin [Cryptosporangium aurantiacum]
MDSVWVRVVVLVVVLAAATVGGLVWRARTGRVRPVAAADPPAAPIPTPAARAEAAGSPAGQAAGAEASAVGGAAGAEAAGAEAAGVGAEAAAGAGVWAQLGIEPGNAAVTLVQFSSAFCAPCRATRQVLKDVVSRLPETAHVEVDAESHLDVVRVLDVRSTPTTLLVDRNGRIAGRAVGQPRRDDVLAAVGPFLSPGP